MRRLRMAIQLVAFALFLFLLLTAVKPLRGVSHEAFLRFDPLIAITAMLAARTFIVLTVFAGVTLVVTALFGRVFCGWVCPLGTTLDLFNALFLRRRRNPPNRPKTPEDTPAKWYLVPFFRAKYVLLVVVLAMALLGVQAAGWFDPISIATRTYGMVVIPAGEWLLDGATKPFDALHGRLYDSGYVLRPIPNIYTLMWLNAALFAGIIGLEVAQRRWWCRHLCPLGGLLGLVGRWNLLPVRIDTECTSCLRCERICPTAAIRDGKVAPAECIQCFDCTSTRVCSAPHVTHRLGLPLRAKKDEAFSVVPSRRAFVASVVGGIVAAPLLAKGFRKAARTGAVVRPPGGQDEAELLARCIRCGECMRVCPNNAIHPCVLESGFQGFMTPRLIARIGYCEFDCAGKVLHASAGDVNNLCGKVCPTGALRRLSREDKQAACLGTAYVDRSECIPWIHGEACWQCAQACPVEAIYAAEEDAPALDDNDDLAAAIRKLPAQKPVVDASVCIGCGRCEFVCPVEGRSAIRIHRRQLGPA